MADIFDKIADDIAEKTGQAAVGSVAFNRTNPALAARAKILADRYGAAPALVAQQPEAFEELDRKDNAELALGEHKWMQGALAEDPSIGPMLGKDDLFKIGDISRALGMTPTATASPFASPNYTQMFPDVSKTPVPKAPPRRVGWSGHDYDRAAVGVLGTAIGNTAHALAGYAQAGVDFLGFDEETRDYFNRDEQNFQKNLARLMPSDLIQTDTQKAAFGGLASVVQTLLPLGVVGKGKLLLTLGLESAGLAYGKYQEKGAGKLASAGGATAEGAIEYLTEKLPIGFLTKGKLLNGSAREYLTELVLGEVGGEQLATLGQDAVEQLVAPDPGHTWKDYWNERPAAAYSTLIATGTMLGVVGGGGVVARTLATKAEDTRDSIAALSGQRILDEVMKSAENVEMRKNAPDEFAKLIAKGAENSPVKYVYLPIEAVEAVIEDETIPDEEKAAFTLYQDQIDEARISGGEVVIPIGEAAAHFSGTKAWESMREEARVLAGGISGREAREHMETLVEDLEKLGDETLAESDKLTPEIEAKAQVYDEVKKQVIAAGRSEKEARTTGALVASRAENLASKRYGKFKDAREAWDWMKLQIQGPGVEQAKGGRRVAQLAPGEAMRGLPRKIKVGDEVIEFGPLESARKAAAAVAKTLGIKHAPPETYERVDPARATRIAAAFDAMEHDPSNPEVKAAYDAMIKETIEQYKAVMKTGLKVEFIEGEDPYGNPRNAIRDVVENNHLWVYPTDTGFGTSKEFDASDNPLLQVVPGFKISGKAVRANDLFRVVHDYFGHIMEGNGFRADGEETAWRLHSAMYSPLARRAMTTETRGQNSWVNYGPFGEANRTAGPAETVYADQKIGLLPEWISEEGREDPEPRRFGQEDLSPLDRAASAVGALEIATSRKWNTNRDFKEAVQNAVKAASSGDLRDRARLTKLALADARLALQQNKNAIGWYDEKLQQAMAVLGTLHPEIETDENARFAFIYALAVTSTGLKVNSNFRLADRVYREYKKNGTMPTDMGEGNGANAMKVAFKHFNNLVDKMGVEGLRDFMTTEHTVGEIEKTLGIPVGGEHKGTKVKGAAFLGPKIGNGYFSNLYGDYSRLTMDRWFMRTWGRWTGSLIVHRPAQIKEARSKTLQLMRNLTPAERKAVDKLLSVKGQPFKMNLRDPEAFAKQVRLRTVKADVRAGLAAINPRLRLDPKGYALALDGQKEAPQSAAERNEIRALMGPVLTELQQDFPSLTMADLQAVLWYPEKTLYDTSKQKVDTVAKLGYENDEAPDYANAAVALARDEGVDEDKINAATERGRARAAAAERARGAGRSAGAGAVRTSIPEDENGFPLEDVLVSAGDGTTDPMVLHQFGGYHAALDATAKTARYDAVRMEREGIDPETIWRRTGWMRGADELWRFEIDDSEAYILNTEPSPLLDEEESTPGIEYLYSDPKMWANEDGRSNFWIGERLGDLLSHPTLFKHYPQLKNMAVFKVPMPLKQHGFFDGYSLALNSNISVQEQLSTLLHETQHAIQTIEGFANGASPAVDALIELGLGDEYMKYLDYYRAVNRGEIPHWRFKEPRTEAELQASAAFAVYERVAGEVEARNTQARSNFSAAERREKFPDLTADFERENVLLPQPEMAIAAASTAPPEGPRPARGEARFYPDGRTIIQLFKADFSTMLHEMSHVFLEQEFKLAKEKGASEELKADVASLEKWFAEHGFPVEKGKIPVEAHELFARTGERYFREGKSPSAELRSAFKQFKEWLSSVYKSVQDLLAYGPAPINPEIRDIMSRMIATTEAIEANATAPMSQEELGMTTAEYDAYLDSVNTAKDVAHDALLERLMKTIRRREANKGKAQRAEIRAEVEQEVNSDPRFIALHLLRTGRWLGDPNRERVEVKINTGWLIDNYGEEVLSLLPVGLQPLHRGDGVAGDAIAEMVGLPSGDALVKALLTLKEQADELKAAGNPRPLRDQMIEDRTDELMATRHGDMGMSESEIEEEAIAALNSNRQGEVLATELRQLKKQKGKGGVVTPYQLLREWARRKVNEGTVADAVSKQALQRYVRAYNKARSLFEDAILGGKADEAIKQKQAQMINHALLAEGKVVADEINTIVRRLLRYSRTKAMASIDQDYMDRIHELLEGYNFRPVSDASRAEKASFEQWAEGQKALGHEVYVPVRFRDQRTNWKDAKVSKLLELNDMVQSLAAQGKLKQRLIIAGEERALDEMRDTLEASILSLPERNVGEASTGEISKPFRQAIRQAKTFREYAKAIGTMFSPGKRVRQMASGLVKIEGVADILDASKMGTGVLNKVVIGGATNAVNEFTRLTEEVMDPIVQLYRGISGKMAARLNDHVTITELTLNAGLHEGDPRIGQPLNITRKQLLALVANTGNLSNLSKLVGGERWGDPESAADMERVRQTLISYLSQEEMDLVQAMWDGIAKLWPHIARVERELTGIVPEAVVPTEFTAFGKIYSGGYWPVVWDSQRTDVGKPSDEHAESNLFGVGQNLGTPKGHTITRTGAMAPMDWSLEGVLFGHTTKVISRIAYAPWVRDSLKLLNSPRVSGAIRLRLGNEYLGAIKHWMKDQIPSNMVDVQGAKWWEGVLNQTRINFTIGVLGVSYSTGVAQALGLSYSAGVLGEGNAKDGPRWLSQGFAKMVQLQMPGQPGAQEFVFTRSEEMRRRATELNREVIDVFRNLKTDSGGKIRHARDWLQAKAFWHIAFIDLNTVSIPTWLGGYQKAIAQGLTEEEAAAYGDKVVRLSQGSGREKDMSAIQRGTAAQRLITMFYTPSSVFFNQQWEAAQHMKAGGWSKALVPTFWFLVVTTILDAMREGDWPEDDDDDGAWLDNLPGWVARNLTFGAFYGVPVARDISNTAERKIRGEYAEWWQLPPTMIAESVAKGVKSGAKVATGEEATGKDFKNMVSAIGFTLGLPGNQPGKTVGFLKDVSDGTAQPQGPEDWFDGFTKGKLDADEESNQ